MNRIYLIYDGRAANGDTDSALVCDTADSLSEAKQSVRESFQDGVIYSYLEEPINGEGGLNGRLFDERYEWMLISNQKEIEK